MKSIEIQSIKRKLWKELMIKLEIQSVITLSKELFQQFDNI
jgi:hypothetical protein